MSGASPERERPVADDQPPDAADLAATPTIEAGHPAVRAFAAAHGGGLADPRERAVGLYYGVRDGYRYDPYGLDLTLGGMSASGVLSRGNGWCVNKAVLLTAACRAAGIPARLGFADVKNHLSTERLRALLQTDVFYWHGYASLWIDEQWVKATPAFNLGLCQKFRLKPLEFDGREDSIYHAFDEVGQRHMEYLAFRGDYQDLPMETIRADFTRYYPALVAKGRDEAADFDRDVARETGR